MELPPAGGGLLARRTKNRNTKGLALSSAAAKPGTLAGSSAADLVKPPVPARPSVGGGGRPAPIQVAGSSRSNRTSLAASDSSSSTTSFSRRGSADSNNNLPTTPSHYSSSSATSSSSAAYHTHLNEQLASLELGVEFKLDLRNEDLQVLSELGSGNGGTVSKALHVPTKAVMAKKVVHIATSDVTRKQILRELQIMHDCSSPYIVSFYGAYLSDPHISMCMEFMDKGC
ncbi:hypothetical protein JCM8547_004844, partial [Rhodosporidiobolus lusitaniae]